MKGIEIKITDLDTGVVQTRTIVDDVLVITTGRHYVASAQKYANGTSIWTIKVSDDDDDGPSVEND